MILHALVVMGWLPKTWVFFGENNTQFAKKTPIFLPLANLIHFIHISIIIFLFMKLLRNNILIFTILFLIIFILVLGLNLEPFVTIYFLDIPILNKVSGIAPNCMKRSLENAAFWKTFKGFQRVIWLGSRKMGKIWVGVNGNVSVWPGLCLKMLELTFWMIQCLQ